MVNLGKMAFNKKSFGGITEVEIFRGHLILEGPSYIFVQSSFSEHEIVVDRHELAFAPTTEQFV